jgi:segregation and condensation protein A
VTYEVKLDVFEGPFQLLLTLIAEQRVDVCDVPIAKLTEEYIAHIERMGHADLEVTTEFLVVAATLLALKARALLPAPRGELEDEDEHERDLLIARLFEVRTYQDGGTHLSGLLAEGDLRFSALPAPDDEALRLLPSLAGIAADDLARTLVEVVTDSLREVDTSKVVVDQVSTQEAAEELLRSLESGPTRFDTVARGRGVTWAVALFLAVLELAMRGDIELSEGGTVGELELRLRPAS